LLALDKLLGNTEDAAKVAAELAHLPAEKARASDKNAANDKQTPFEAYRDSLPRTWPTLGESIQNDVVDGLEEASTKG
jgi:hypothetical protein